MPPNVQSPVQLQSPVVTPEGINSMARRPVGRRRIFVQTPEGKVLGMELDRGDKVESVKKRVQAALRIPTDQSDLVYGDVVLEKDLREVRSDFPILLTRGILYRSSSSPCLSPVLDYHKQKDGTQKAFEIIGGYLRCSNSKRLIRECEKAIEKGVEPVPARGGLGGSYYFMNTKGHRIAIVKPTDEEPFAPNNPKGLIGKVLGQPGMRQSVRVGETGIREVAAYLLDHDRFAKVPPTVLVKATHSVFHVNRRTPVKLSLERSEPVTKIASFQHYVHHNYDASELGTSRFPVSAVHRIGVLDVRIFNTDRHSGNVLVRRLDFDEVQGGQNQFNTQVNENVELIPIDHGLCLPETFEDPYFEWLHWPQASFPFSEEELEYIKNLNAAKDIEMLRSQLPMLRDVCLRMLALTTVFLQEAAAAGLCLAEIGSMMSRGLSDCGEEFSDFETICMLAKNEVEEELSVEVLENLNEEAFSDSCNEDDFFPTQFHMDFGDDSVVSHSARILEETLGCSTAFYAEEGDNKHQFLMNRNHPTFHDNAVYDISSDSCFTDNTSSKPFPAMSGMFNEVCGSMQDLSLKHSSRSNLSLHSVGNISENIKLKWNKFVHHGTSEENKSVKAQGISTSEAAQRTRVAQGDLALPVLSAMSEKEWISFLQCFKSLLQIAFSGRKSSNPCHSQRFGTSCEF